ncbi:MAG: DUF7453 family protein, partial [Phycisphaerae bacterium]
MAGVLVSFAAHIHASVIFESATSGPTGQGDGAGLLVSDTFNMAVNFEVTESVLTGRVGAHVLGLGGNEPVFAAIVGVSGPVSPPSAVDLAAADLRGVTILAPSDLSDNISGNLRVVLEPGWYALVIGTNQFGATGEAALLGNNDLVGDPLIYGIRQSDGKIITQSSSVRFFVDSMPLPAFEMVVDTSTVIPDAELEFDSFSSAALRDGYVVFEGRAPFNSEEHEEGIYQWNEGELVTLANRGTTMPGATESFFQFAGLPSTSQGETVFFGVGQEGTRGVYVSDGSMLRRVADQQVMVPGTDVFFDQFTGWPTIHKGNVTFMAQSELGPGYIVAEIDGELQVMASDGTIDPDGEGILDFILVGLTSIDHDTVSFRAVRGDPLLVGLYKTDGDSVQTIIDSNQQMPGLEEPVGIMGHGILRDGEAAFAAANDVQVPTAMGLFVTDQHSSEIERRADLDTPVPDG